MAQHNITLIATGKSDDGTTANAITGPDLATDVVSITSTDVIAIVSDPTDVLGVAVAGVAVEPGDTVVVTGAAGRIPDFQVGCIMTVDDTGRAHFANAGILAWAITSVSPH